MAQAARKDAWISKDTWMIVDKRVSARQGSARDQALIQHLGRNINTSIKGDMRRRAEEVDKEIEWQLVADPPLHNKAWPQTKGWYKYAVGHAPLPAWVKLEQIMAEHGNLYRQV